VERYAKVYSDCRLSRAKRKSCNGSDIALREQSRPAARDLIENFKHDFYTAITYEDDYAYYCNDPPLLYDSDIGIQNYICQPHGHGSPINALCRWYHITGDTNDLELAEKLSRFVRQPQFWQPETEPEFFTGVERAHFKGHIHSYCTALMGLLKYADTANEAWLKEFVRNGYEWIRNTGIPASGFLEKPAL